jgi:hypothetical protein
MAFFSALLGGIFDLCLAAYAILFAWLRVAEIEQLVANEVGAGVAGALFLINILPGYIGRIRCYHMPLRAQVILAVIGLVYYLDVVQPRDVLFPEGERWANLRGRVAVVTAPGSGRGFEIASALVKNGVTVILACRDAAPCSEASSKLAVPAALGNARVVVGAPLDLGSFASVKAFVDQLNGPVDFLINNPVFPTFSGTPPGADGLEVGYKVLHLGHFYLTDLMMSRRSAGEHLRVVNIVSKMQTVCAVLECFKDSGNVEEGGILGSTDGLSSQRAQFANVLHAWSIPSRYNDASALSVNYGFDQTDANEVIHKVVNPADLGLESLNVGLTRTGQSAVACVLTALTRKAQGGPSQGLVMETLFGVHEPWRSLPPLVLLFQGILKIEEMAKFHLPYAELARKPYLFDEAFSLRESLWKTSEALISARAADSKPKGSEGKAQKPVSKPVSPPPEAKPEPVAAVSEAEAPPPQEEAVPPPKEEAVPPPKEEAVPEKPSDADSEASGSTESPDESTSAPAEKKKKKKKKKKEL